MAATPMLNMIKTQARPRAVRLRREACLLLEATARISASEPVSFIVESGRDSLVVLVRCPSRLFSSSANSLISDNLPVFPMPLPNS